ncbi:hypothetical protein, partial [Pseudomonas tohonis]|uniref:hypothetical protein n=1 Tax=Pseudomonas tohonis TaxID=2725477 RepID=UPI001F18CF2D
AFSHEASSRPTRPLSRAHPRRRQQGKTFTTGAMHRFGASKMCSENVQELTAACLEQGIP